MAKPTQRRGLKGNAGAKGAQGRPGTEGKRGAQGPVGPAGPKMKPGEVLAIVDDQFNELRKQLDLQLQRTAQLQLQLDQIQKNTTQACAPLDVMHPLIKGLVAKG